MISRFILSHKEVEKFISDYDKLYDGGLSDRMNYSRVVSLAHFESMIRRLGIGMQKCVGVVSGSEHEPELKLMRFEKLKVLNFTSDDAYDLDKDWSGYPSDSFSFTLCNQVFEHVFNPHVALRNLSHLTSVGGYIYVNIPTLNCIHDEPYFYSSGFHPRFLERLGQENGLQVLDIGWWGSYKYLINAVCGRWLSRNQLRPGIHSIDDLRYPMQIFENGLSGGNDSVIADCWVLYRKNE